MRLRDRWRLTVHVGHYLGSRVARLAGFILVLAGFSLLVRYLGRAAILAVPLLLLLVGTALFLWLRGRERKHRREDEERRRRGGR
ncbi:MAG: hypothetical protein H0X38_05730 [Planctomycetes bacterium]|nr:hypothetical protein [Planctomycetota bacterium]